MKTVLAAILACTCGQALAVYQCKDAQGKVSFQQTPCASGEQQRKVEVRNTTAAGTGPAASGAEPSQALAVEQRIAARNQYALRLISLQRQVDSTEAAIAQRNAQMEAEMNLLSARKSLAKNNLAGATWEQSLSTEMAALAAKYKTMNDVDLERLKVLRLQLAEAQAAPKP